MLLTTKRGRLKQNRLAAWMRINYPTLRRAADFLKALKEFFLHARFGTANEIEGFHVMFSP